MAFLIFKKEVQNGKTYYHNEHKHYKLAGYGLLYRLWVKRGKPTNQGWSVSAGEILNEYDKTFTGDSHALLIDFDPNSKERIGIIEIIGIHLFTHGADSVSRWSPMMLELLDLYYEDDFEKELTPEEKEKLILKIEVSQVRNPNVEFLYLQGDERSWNWGRNGSTNAAFIGGEARKYFRTFF